MNRLWPVGWLACFVALVALACADTAEEAAPPIIGEEPAVKRHISQAGIEAGKFTLEELIEHGRDIFTAPFNILDGSGRPAQTGKGDPRKRRVMPDNFNRVSAPDANACMACHNLPAVGGGGDNAVNVFLLSDFLPFVDFDGDPVLNGPNNTLKTIGNERNTPGMFGAGFIELLSREMTADMHAIRDAASKQAKRSGQNATFRSFRSPASNSSSLDRSTRITTLVLAMCALRSRSISHLSSPTSNGTLKEAT